jgi:hypothetical protein
MSISKLVNITMRLNWDASVHRGRGRGEGVEMMSKTIPQQMGSAPH